MTLVNNVRLVANTTLTETVGIAAVTAVSQISISDSMSTSDAIFTADASLTGTGTASYDLRGSLTNPINAAVTFATVKMLYIKNKSALALKIGGANNIPLLDGSTDQIKLAAGCTLFTLCDIAVTAGTGDLITIDSTVAAYSAAVYPINSIVRYTDNKIYKAKQETSNTWVAGEWEEQSFEDYEIVVLGVAPTP